MPEAASPLDLLLDTIQRAKQRGEIVRARAVARMLTRQYPDSPQAWQALADLAEDEDERNSALKQIQVLNPVPYLELPSPLPVAQSVWEEPAELSTGPVELTGTIVLEARARRMRWPILLVTGIAVAAIIVLLIWRLGGFEQSAIRTVNIPSAIPIATVATLIPTPVSAIDDAPTAGPLPTSVVPPTPLPSATPIPTSGPTPTPRPVHAFGAVVEQGTWTVTLLRPEHALLLEGSIGNLQPHGRFALALMAIANDGTTAARVPAGLIMLVDIHGTTYLPVVEASAAYLNTYGRGQFGDLSLNEAIPADAGNVSVPVIFDIPPDAHDLQLFVAGDSVGWQMPGQ